jgi:hypothetical protein
MSAYRLRDMGLKVRDLMRVRKARQWLLDHCDKHLAARWEPGWRPCPFLSDGGVASDVTLPEKAVALVAFREIVLSYQGQSGPAPWPAWKLNHQTQEQGIHWGYVVSEIKEKFRVEHLSWIEAWLDDVVAAMHRAGIRSAPATRKGSKPKLTKTERVALSIIKAQPKGRGISGKEIIAELKRKNIILLESTLRRHILPKLAEHFGVVNQRAAGGYLIP